MKKLIVVALLVSCLPAISLAAAKISMPEMQWDYGIVPQNAILSHPYLIKNVGDDTLRNIDVKPG